MYNTIIKFLAAVFSIIELLGINTYGVADALALDSEMHIVVDYLDNGGIEYQGTTYYLPQVSFLKASGGELEASGEYEYIGWSGDRIFHFEYYGDSAQTPTFIYNPDLHETYLREDYDYRTDIFVVEETDIVISFDDDLLDTDYADTNLFGRERTFVSISSVSCPPLKATLSIINDGGVWYAVSNDKIAFELSERLVDVLLEKEIINE